LIAVNGLNISNPDYGHERWNNLAEEYIGNLVGVIDGDTIEILHKQHTNVSASMVDCPENGQAYGKRAKQGETETV
jgi:endonuclease YncB( thermonuclease family)